ncbi:MAG: hypothetical protein V1663_04345 [archaeon]
MNPKKTEGWDSIVSYREELNLLDMSILFRRYGFCIPHRIELLKKRRIVYRWDRHDETREEFFFGEKKPTRKYEDNQFCFLEYCEIVHNQKRFPETNELKGLDKSIMEKYKGFLEKIINE